MPDKYSGLSFLTPPQKTRAKKEDIVHVADVVRHGDKLIVPETMSYDNAINVLARQRDDEEQLISINEPVDCFPWEGALAFKKAIEQEFGYSGTISTPGFFGPNPPREIAIETGVDSKTLVPWGRFSFALGTEEEYLETTTAAKDGRMIFAVGGVVKKKWKATIHRLAERTREIVKADSIYRGQALRIAFTNSDGDTEHLPQPKFIDLRNVDLGEMVYTDELTQLIETNILTPLKHADALRAAKIPLKRGVLAAGPYGTGKSLLARAVAKVGTENGWTFVYIKDASELPQAIGFAKLYQPAVIFAEDVDRHVTGERTDKMDMILNTLDGIDSKHTEIMTVLTTNHLDQINRAMLRPGRLDVILNIVPPDAKAVERLVRVYARQGLAPDADLTRVGEVLAGYTPAIIREVVERAKLSTIGRTGAANAAIEAQDIEVSAATMVQQQNLLAKPEVPAANWGDELVTAVADRAYENLKTNGLGKQIAQSHQILENVYGPAR